MTRKEINEFCALWERTREPQLAALMVENGWIADRPLTLRLYSALKADDLEYAEAGGYVMVEALIQACMDRDPEIASRADHLLHHLQRRDTREELCRLVLEFNHAQARAIAIRAGYAPKNPARRALFFFLTGQWEAYEQLDHDQTLLASAYAAGDEALRRRIREQASKAGRTEWVAAAAGGRQSKRVGQMTDAEWAAAWQLLRENGRHDEMWRLAQLAPPVWSVRLVRSLAEAGFAPGSPDERDGFSTLQGLAAGLEDEPAGLVGRAVVLKTARLGAKTMASRDGRYLVSSQTNAHVWRLDSGELSRTVEGRRFRFQALALSPDGDWLAGSSFGVGFQLWRLPSGAEHPLPGMPQSTAQALAFGPGLLAAGTRDRELWVWDLAQGRSLGRFEGKTKAVDALAFTPDGRWLLSGSNAHVQAWRLPEGRFVKAATGHTARVQLIVTSADSCLAASTGYDRWICLWSLAEGQPLKLLASLEADVGSLAFSSDGRVLVGGGRDGKLRFWSVKTGAPLRELAWPGTPTVTVGGERVYVTHTEREVLPLDVRLSRLLPGGGEGEASTWVLAELADPSLPEAERRWLEYWLAQTRFRKRFDIGLAPVPRQLALGAYDIQLED